MVSTINFKSKKKINLHTKGTREWKGGKDRRPMNRTMRCVKHMEIFGWLYAAIELTQLLSNKLSTIFQLYILCTFTHNGIMPCSPSFHLPH